jgi:glycosyltransferase involved in cell wall biosynthesis
VRIAVVGNADSVNVQQWCEGLRAAGADIEVVSFAPGWSPVIPTHVLKPPAAGRVRYVVARRAARRVLSAIAPDVVIGYYATGYGTLAALAGRRPLVVVTAGNDVLVNPRGTLRHRLTLRTLQRADLVIALAPHMADAVRTFGVDSERIFTHVPGIPLEPFLTAGRTRPRLPTPRRVVVTRALEPFYRVDVIIRAVATLGPDREEATLTIVGDGPARSSLRRLAADVGVADRVHFTGSLPYEDLPMVLAEHDAYVSAAPSDGVSASLLEAMATGLVPVVDDNDANRYWLTDGENGVLVEAGSPDAVAAGLRFAFDNTELQETARTRNPEIAAERADLSRNAAQFLEQLTMLIGSRGV